MATTFIYGVLIPGSPFACIFPDRKVPLKGILPVDVSLLGDAKTRAFFVNWDALSPDQMTGLAEKLAELRGGTAREIISAMERGEQLPLRESQVETVVTNIPFML